MKRLPADLLERMGRLLAPGDRDEMAIPSYLHPNPVLRWMAWRRVEVVADRLARCLERRQRATRRVVLDYGCGTGVLLEEASRHADVVYGVDLVLTAAELLVAERGLDRVRLGRPDDLDRLVAPGSVDVVVAAEVLEHIDPPGEVISDLRSRLAPTGRLLVSLPTEGTLYRFGRWLAGFSGHYHHWNARRLHAEITRRGFLPVWRRRIPAPDPLAIYWVVEYEPGPVSG